MRELVVHCHQATYKYLLTLDRWILLLANGTCSSLKHTVAQKT